jgi:hypothetical protein
MSDQLLSGITKVDTDKMQAWRFVQFDVTGDPVIIVIPILRVEGPGIFFSRKRSGRVVNARKS